MIGCLVQIQPSADNLHRSQLNFSLQYPGHNNSKLYSDPCPPASYPLQKPTKYSTPPNATWLQPKTKIYLILRWSMKYNKQLQQQIDYPKRKGIKFSHWSKIYSFHRTVQCSDGNVIRRSILIEAPPWQGHRIKDCAANQTTRTKKCTSKQWRNQKFLWSKVSLK